jgi:hypothetical protein
MQTTLNAPPAANGNGRHLNNYRIFRPQAVEASATRQVGEPWVARVRFENWIMAGLTLIAAAAALLIFRGGY